MDRSGEQQRVARAASLVSVGSLLSRVMGLVREMVIAGVFGASGPVDAYKAAQQVPLQLYEMLIGGMTSSALVPTFSEYATEKDRDVLWQVASLLFTVTGIVLACAVLVLEMGVPLLSRALVHFEPPLQSMTTDLLRIVLIGVLFLGLSGIATALCHALQRFTLPAFAAVAFNVSIVLFGLILGPASKNVRVLAVGLVVGTALQFVIQLPALHGMRFRPSLDLSHPALRQILRLYAPVVLSLGVAGLGVLLDRNLASRTGESRITWMSFATTLRQFPLGLVSLAVSTAILPRLSALAALERGATGMRDEHRAAFCATFAGGLRLVLFLTLPAAVGLVVLAHPLVALFFQHGLFESNDTIQTALALRYYVIGMVFAAVDLPLVFAFYARQDTMRPALVGAAGVGLYVLIALPTYRSLGMVGLILANDAQLAGHALIMLWLFVRRVGGLGGKEIGSLLLKSALGSVLMGSGTYATMHLLAMVFPWGGKLGWGVTVVGSGVVGVAIYLGVCALLRVRELQLLKALVTRLWLVPDIE